MGVRNAAPLLVNRRAEGADTGEGWTWRSSTADRTLPLLIPYGLFGQFDAKTDTKSLGLLAAQCTQCCQHPPPRACDDSSHIPMLAGIKTANDVFGEEEAPLSDDCESRLAEVWNRDNCGAGVGVQRG